MKLLKIIFKQIKTKYYQIFYFQRRSRIKLSYRLKIKEIYKKHPQLSKKTINKDFEKASKDFLRTNFNGYCNTSWHHFYASFSGIKDPKYIPEEVYFGYMEPAFNNPQIKKAYTDKNAYSLFIDKMYMPKTIFKIINGSYFTENSDWIESEFALNQIINIEDKLILKPANDSGGGNKIYIGAGKEIASLLKSNPYYQNNNLILQYFANQHPRLSAFHSKSLNTFRITTARIKNEIVILYSCFRMGRNGNLMDNTVTGGLYVNVTPQGLLHQIAYDNDSYKYVEHPDSGIKFHNYKIPGFKKAIEFCKSTHKKLIQFKVISWDIGVQEDETPLFIEFNMGAQAINALQILNGPMFGEHTEYFIQEYKDIVRSSDYNII